MGTPIGDALSSRIQELFPRLATAAAELNQTSDELSKLISEVDSHFKRLNLGVTAWVQFALMREGTLYEVREIGYTKINKQWGIALRTIEGDDRQPHQDAIETWLFNESPRMFRTQALKELPALIEKLIEAAASMKKQMEETKDTAKQVTTALSGPQAEPTDARPISELMVPRTVETIGGGPKTVELLRRPFPKRYTAFRPSTQASIDKAKANIGQGTTPDGKAGK